MNMHTPQAAAMIKRRNKYADYKTCADAGLTAAQTARKLGVHYFTAQSATFRHGLTFTPSRPNRDAEYVELATLGFTVRDAAEKIGVHTRTVYNAQKRLGILFKAREKAKPAPQKTVVATPAPVKRAVFSASPKAVSRYFEGARA